MTQATIVAKHLQILGLVMKDIVTGIEGMVDSVSFDTYGCVQASLRVKVKDDGTVPTGHWFDVKRLKEVKKRLMDVPTFPALGQEQGAAEKPMRQ